MWINQGNSAQISDKQCISKITKLIEMNNKKTKTHSKFIYLIFGTNRMIFRQINNSIMTLKTSLTSSDSLTKAYKWKTHNPISC